MSDGKTDNIIKTAVNLPDENRAEILNSVGAGFIEGRVVINVQVNHVVT